jgi:aminoglycoside phosphotransferase (APT) family kinase protein
VAGDRIEVAPAAARRLVAAQFPEWADLPVRPVATPGWDNLTFRLGDALKLRLPSAARYVAAVEKERTWLPRLAPHLPVEIPVPLAVGVPGEGYPWPWSVQRWIEGAPLARGLAGEVALARQVAGFLRALQAAPEAGPPAGAHSFHRGGDLAVYDGETRRTLAALGPRVDAAAALGVWQAALGARWQGSPVWVHGDVAVGNLLVRDGRLAAVIDWGTSAVGDPACDLVLAWTFFGETGRAAFREAVAADAATWARARGWALWKALLVLAGGGAVHPAERSPAAVVAAVTAEAASIEF